MVTFPPPLPSMRCTSFIFLRSTTCPILPKDRPLGKPLLKKSLACQFKFCPLCPASSVCDTPAVSIGCGTPPSCHTRSPHRSTNVKPSSHTTHISQPFPISFLTRLPKIIFSETYPGLTTNGGSVLLEEMTVRMTLKSWTIIKGQRDEEKWNAAGP